MAHLLDHLLHLACVCKFTLNELILERLLDLGSQVELVLDRLVLVEDLLHVASLGLLQVRSLQLASRIAHHVPQVVLRTRQEWIECVLLGRD